MDDQPETPADTARRKRERILAVSRNVHQIPVEEGGMLRPARKSTGEPLQPNGKSWARTALVAGGLAALASGFAAGLWVRRRD